LLNPLGFLSAKGMPAEASSFHFVRIEMVEGHRTAVVKAKADLKGITNLFPTPATATVQNGEIAMWIDLNNKTLVRAFCRLTWDWNIGNRTAPGGMTFVETHHNVKIDSLLRDEEFSFVPSKGAQEKFK
jgi:hypothetical protein